MSKMKCTFRLDDNLMVKVSDFGLAKDVHDTDYYKVEDTSTTALPIRWMSIESIQNGIFTAQSDMVSI